MNNSVIKIVRCVSNIVIKKRNITSLSVHNIYKTNKFTLSNFIKRYLIKYSTMTAIKPKVVFVLGGPGSGKGTQCQKISEHFGYVHLSAGDLLREERLREGSEHGELIETIIKNGQIVPVEITCALLENAMTKNIKENGTDKFLIDGFPRNQNNVDGWTEQMGEKVELQFILFFECPESLCVERCLNRGKQGSGRSDDNEESLKKRCHTYINDSKPVIEHYRKQNLVRQIEATCDPESVFEKVKQAFKNLRDEVGDF